jgi:hypothetical protein
MSAEPLPLLLTDALIRQHVLPVGRRTLQRMICAETFPAPDCRLNGKRFWRRETVLNWLAEYAPTQATTGVRDE